MPVFVTVRDDFQERGSAGVGFPVPANPRRFSLTPANFRREAAGEALPPRVIHMLILRQWTKVARYLLVTIAGGGWNPPGGGWKQPENTTPRRFDLVTSQLNISQRGLAGVGGGSLIPYTGEITNRGSDQDTSHVKANRTFATPANPRRTPVRISRSRDVTTQAGAR